MTSPSHKKHGQLDIHRLKELFCQVIDEPPHTRARWLADRSRDICTELREELCSLLASHAAAGRFLSEPTIDFQRLPEVHECRDMQCDSA